MCTEEPPGQTPGGRRRGAQPGDSAQWTGAINQEAKQAGYAVHRPKETPGWGSIFVQCDEQFASITSG